MPTEAEFTYLKWFQYSMNSYFRIMSLVNRYPTSPRITTSRLTGFPRRPALLWEEDNIWRGHDHNCSVLFWKPVAECFHRQSKINTLPTCSVHSFTPLGYLYTNPSPRPHYKFCNSRRCLAHFGTPSLWPRCLRSNGKELHRHSNDLLLQNIL